MVPCLNVMGLSYMGTSAESTHTCGLKGLYALFSSRQRLQGHATPDATTASGSWSLGMINTVLGKLQNYCSGCYILHHEAECALRRLQGCGNLLGYIISCASHLLYPAA